MLHVGLVTCEERGGGGRGSGGVGPEKKKGVEGATGATPLYVGIVPSMRLWRTASVQRPPTDETSQAM